MSQDRGQEVARKCRWHGLVEAYAGVSGGVGSCGRLFEAAGGLWRPVWSLRSSDPHLEI